MRRAFIFALIMLLAGFLAPLPYNYWRLKALGKLMQRDSDAYD